MKAAVWHGKEDIRVEEASDPAPGKGQVKARIKACGICGSDLHEYRDGPFLIPKRPHPLTHREGGPLILGHEFSAEVVELGEGVATVKPGDRVVCNPLIYCGSCHYCRHGFFTDVTKLVSKDGMEKAIEDSVPRGLVEQNLNAVERGLQYNNQKS